MKHPTLHNSMYTISAVYFRSGIIALFFKGGSEQDKFTLGFIVMLTTPTFEETG